MSETLTPTGNGNGVQDVTTAPPSTRAISEQLAVYERAGNELRRRMKEERQRLVSDFERRLAAYEADVRAAIIDMQAAHEHELQAHDRLVKRFGTLG